MYGVDRLDQRVAAWSDQEVIVGQHCCQTKQQQTAQQTNLFLQQGKSLFKPGCDKAAKQKQENIM